MPDLIPIMMDPEQKRAAIRQRVLEGLRESFPVKSRNKTLEISDLKFTDKDFSPIDQKTALLQGDTLHEAVKGTLRLRDKDGKLIDELKNFTMARIPWFTPRHTFIVGGNEYSVSNMVRPKPGVYARKRANEILEANFNIVGGQNFNITMDPEKGEPQLEYGSSKIPLYTILRKAGVSHERIAKIWGRKLAEQNYEKLNRNAAKHVDKLYNKIIPRYRQKVDADTSAKIDEIFARYADTYMDPDVTEATLGKRYSSVSQDSLLDASGKVLQIFRQDAEVDDRDNLDFKTIHGVEDFFKERIKLDARDVVRKTAIKMEAVPELKKAIASGPFTKGILKFINSSQLASVPTQTNPMELIDAAMRVTSLGEGGISSERAIPIEARYTHPTQIGALDPIRTPESFRAGVDVRAAMMVKRDNNGNIYVPVYDVKKRKSRYIRAGEIQRKVLAFPGQELKGSVDVLDRGQVRTLPASRVDYQIPHVSAMYSPTTNLVPFLESSQGNRAIMGSKMSTQALSLLGREAPLVQVKAQTGESFESLMGKIINPTAPISGTITKVDNEYIYICPDGEKVSAVGGKIIKVPYEKDFPLASKTYLDHKILVRRGDHVKKGQILGESNFTQGGKLALGKNLRVAYMPYYGANSNDAVVVSDSGAGKLTSERMYKIVVPRDNDLTFNREKHRTYYGHGYTKNQYGPLDSEGIVRPGSEIKSGDPVILGLRKSEMTADDIILGKLHRSLAKPFREFKQGWDHDYAGEVIDVVKTPKRIALTIKTKERASVGDKIAGRYGNKGVISQIIPDDQMIADEAGKPIDLIMTSAGVVSRVNPSQLIESAVGKVAEKTGKPILVENFPGRDNVKWAKDLLKKHGIKDKETVYDPRTGKKIPGVFVGRQFIMKLFKSTDTNYGARGLGSYDINLQPTKGGVLSAKTLGRMEFDALVGHNARNMLREATAIKSQKNDEYWRALQLGYPTPQPKTTFAADKFLNMLTGAGIKVNRQRNILSLAPLTDADVTKLSAGEIKDAKLVRARDLRPETGGLFDPAITGGLQGTKFSHVNLAEPVISPIFRDPVRRLLGMTVSQLNIEMKEKGAKHIQKELAKINIDQRLRELRKSMKKKSGPQLDNDLKQTKYLRALKDVDLTPDKAYIVSKIPVVPPVVRPILPGKGGQEIMYGDINPLYRDLIYINNQFKDVKKSKVLPDEDQNLRPALQEAVGAIYGTNDPVTQKSRARGHKGFLTAIAGTTPKLGYFQSKLISKTQDVSGRGTIVPDVTLGIDEVGIPEDMLWTMYEKFLVKRLVQNGYKALVAREMVEERHPGAKDMLMREIQERPVIVNRAPTLHRYNMLAAFPKAVPGKTIRINPFIETATNSDYDGDCADSHLEFVIDSCYKRLHISECPHSKESVVMKANKELYEVPSGVKVFGYSEKQQKVVLCDVTHFSVHHNLEMVEVTTNTGRKVKVSRDCSMFGMNLNTGKLERFKAEEGIGRGIPRPRYLFSGTQLESITLQNKELLDGVVLTQDLGWLVGVWAGDGWVSHIAGRGPTSVGISTSDSKIRKKFEEVIKQFMPGIVIRDYTNEHYFDGVKCISKKAHANSEIFARLFDEITEGCRGAENKKLPSYFVQAPREFLLGLLGGLLDTDGTVSIVKAKTKNKPQFMAHYTTMSEALADHIGVLATMLGIKSNTAWYQKKKEGNWYCQITLSTPDVARIAKEIPCVHTKKYKNLELLSKEVFDLYSSPNARWDMVPIPLAIAMFLRRAYGTTHNASRYIQLSRAVDTDRISRLALYDVMDQVGRDIVKKEFSFGNWFELVTNENILWDFVKEVEQIKGRHTAWDLTVPDGNTFMTSNQLIVFDSMNVHVPVSPEAVEEAKNMTISHMLFSDKARDSLLVFPEMEAIMGLSHATEVDDKNTTPKKFKNQGDAMKAYYAGKIGLGTRVKIGEK